MSEELKRLLELAANAIGHELYINKADAPQLWKDGEYVRFWNPADYDGDALRLAVKLRIDVCHNSAADNQSWVLAERAGCEGCFAPVCCVEDDFDEPSRDASTRLAIVRAAAAIGEAMQ